MSNDNGQTGSDSAAQATPHGQTLEDFLVKPRRPKRTLIEGILSARDLITLVGRRRHGKTTLIGNLALALTLPKPDFLGYPIPQAARVVVFYLEDDETELAEKLKKMKQEENTGERFHLYTKGDFLSQKIPVDASAADFQQRVKAYCSAAKPDLIVFDNLGMLIKGDYNNAPKINQLMVFFYGLAEENDAAVLLAAHPRKQGDLQNNITLKDNPEKFFEECMGSSHTINTTGSLWGIERNDGGTGERTCLLLGSQRRTGNQEFTTVEKDEEEWFRLVSDFDENVSMACNTDKRRNAWGLLPSQPFKFLGAVEIVKGIMAKSSFSSFWRELIRFNLVRPADGDESTYVKASRESYSWGAREEPNQPNQP